jgi:hypothetical protein
VFDPRANSRISVMSASSMSVQEASAPDGEGTPRGASGRDLARYRRYRPGEAGLSALLSEMAIRSGATRGVHG